MITAYSLPTLSEESPVDQTAGSASRMEENYPQEPYLPILDGEQLLILPRELIRSLPPNRDLADQTQADPFGDDRTDSPETDALDAELNRIVFLPLPRPAREHFIALQKWEGYVLEVREHTFLARLVDMDDASPDEEAEIFIEEIAEEDRNLIEPGAVFHWSIGYLDRPAGRIRASIIRFRRLPAWTKHDLDAADAQAAKLRELLDYE